MKKIFIHNIIKNLIVLIILFFSWASLRDFLMKIDNGTAGDILMAVSILAVAAFFGCYSFNYEKRNDENLWFFLAHLTTGLLTFFDF